MLRKKVTLLCFILIFSHANLKPIPMYDSSKIKILVGFLVSGGIGGWIASWFVSDDHKPYWEKKEKIICASFAGVAGILGAFSTFHFFTPEGKIRRARNTLRSLDTSLLRQSGYELGEETNGGLVYRLNRRRGAYPLVDAVRYLESKEQELESRERLLSDQDHPHGHPDARASLREIRVKLQQIDDVKSALKNSSSYWEQHRQYQEEQDRIDRRRHRQAQEDHWRNQDDQRRRDREQRTTVRIEVREKRDPRLPTQTYPVPPPPPREPQRVPDRLDGDNPPSRLGIFGWR